MHTKQDYDDVKGDVNASLSSAAPADSSSRHHSDVSANSPDQAAIQHSPNLPTGAHPHAAGGDDDDDDDRSTPFTLTTYNNALARSSSVLSAASSRQRLRTSFDHEHEVPRLQRWFERDQHPCRERMLAYVDELNALPSRVGRRALDLTNIIYWFKNARAANRRSGSGGGGASMRSDSGASSHGAGDGSCGLNSSFQDANSETDDAAFEAAAENSDVTSRTAASTTATQPAISSPMSTTVTNDAIGSRGDKTGSHVRHIVPELPNRNAVYVVTPIHHAHDAGDDDDDIDRSVTVVSPRAEDDTSRDYCPKDLSLGQMKRSFQRSQQGLIDVEPEVLSGDDDKLKPEMTSTTSSPSLPHNLSINNSNNSVDIKPRKFFQQHLPYSSLFSHHHHQSHLLHNHHHSHLSRHPLLNHQPPPPQQQVLDVSRHDDGVEQAFDLSLPKKRRHSDASRSTDVDDDCRKGASSPLRAAAALSPAPRKASRLIKSEGDVAENDGGVSSDGRSPSPIAPPPAALVGLNGSAALTSPYLNFPPFSAQAQHAMQLAILSNIGYSPFGPHRLLPPVSSTPGGVGAGGGGLSSLPFPPPPSALSSLPHAVNQTSPHTHMTSPMSSVSRHSHDVGSTSPGRGGGMGGVGESSDDRKKRSRVFIDPLTEIPKLEKWFLDDTHPSSYMIEKFTDDLNMSAYRQRFPKLEPKNVQLWFKNHRAKVKRARLEQAALSQINNQVHVSSGGGGGGGGGSSTAKPLTS